MLPTNLKILPATAPSHWITRHSSLITQGGRVLDLACGSGRHAIWLAQQGYFVNALDHDIQALAGMAGTQNIQTQVVDLEIGQWPESHERYDGIIVSRYLHRPLLPVLPKLLNPAGVLIYETFMEGHERYGKPSNPAFLLLRDELIQTYSPMLTIVAFEQGEESMPRPAVMQRICAVQSMNISS